MPLVVLPNDHLESFPRGSEPQEGSGWAAGQEVELESNDSIHSKHTIISI